MTRQVFRAVACAAVIVMGVATGCGSDPAPPFKPQSLNGVSVPGDFSGAGQKPGALSSARTLPTIDRRLRAASSLAARIVYTSTSGVTLAQTQVSGSVFVPLGNAPDGGWPVVAFGHPTTGIQLGCAPSLSANLLGSSEVITALVRAGYVVTVPDYQGLGVEGSDHPFLDPTTAGYNVIDAVRATRKLVPGASDRWVGIGVGQGGQAVWAANELTPNYGTDLSLLGTASLAPLLDVYDLAQAAADGQLTRDQQPMLQLILASLKRQYPDFPVDEFRRGIVKDNWDVLSACQGSRAGERAGVIDHITADDLRPESPQAVTLLQGFLEKVRLPQAPAAAPMMVDYGGQDAVTPAAWTERSILAACRMGDIITIHVQPDKGQTNIDASLALQWVADRFANAGPRNDCAAFIAAHSGASPDAGQAATSEEQSGASAQPAPGEGE
ncbi:MAG: lipase [Mycobacterium sp.]|nr:lipase [Mycobacterium sp.]